MALLLGGCAVGSKYVPPDLSDLTSTRHRKGALRTLLCAGCARLNVGTQNGIHPRLVAFARVLEEIQHVGVNTQRDLLLGARPSYISMRLGSSNALAATRKCTPCLRRFRVALSAFHSKSIASL